MSTTVNGRVATGSFPGTALVNIPFPSGLTSALREKPRDQGSRLTGTITLTRLHHEPGCRDVGERDWWEQHPFEPVCSLTSPTPAIAQRQHERRNCVLESRSRWPSRASPTSQGLAS